MLFVPRGLFVLLVAMLSYCSTAFAAEDGQRFQDWAVRCEKPEGASKETCFIFQGLINEQEKPVLQLAIGYWPETKQPVAIFTVPLGVDLRPGIQFQVDGGETTTVHYSRCDPRGCVAGLPLTDALIDSFKKGSKTQIRIRDGLGRVAEPVLKRAPVIHVLTAVGGRGEGLLFL